MKTDFAVSDMKGIARSHYPHIAEEDVGSQNLYWSRENCQATIFFRVS